MKVVRVQEIPRSKSVGTHDEIKINPSCLLQTPMLVLLEVPLMNLVMLSVRTGDKTEHELCVGKGL